jgi:hypothetical protein
LAVLKKAEAAWKRLKTTVQQDEQECEAGNPQPQSGIEALASVVAGVGPHWPSVGAYRSAFELKLRSEESRLLVFHAS